MSSPLRGRSAANRLSKLARLPCHSTVEDYQERFNALVSNNANLEACQKADLFMGGLPEHIHVDVERRAAVVQQA